MRRAVSRLLQRSKSCHNRILKPLFGNAALSGTPVIERIAEIHLVEDRLGTDSDKLLGCGGMVTLAQRCFNGIKIGLDRAPTKRHRPPRDVENIAVANREQLAKIKQALPQARLGMRFEPAGPQQLAQIVPVNGLIAGETQHCQ